MNSFYLLKKTIIYTKKTENRLFSLLAKTVFIYIMNKVAKKK